MSFLDFGLQNGVCDPTRIYALQIGLLERMREKNNNKVQNPLLLEYWYQLVQGQVSLEDTKLELFMDFVVSGRLLQTGPRHKNVKEILWNKKYCSKSSFSRCPGSFWYVGKVLAMKITLLGRKFWIRSICHQLLQGHDLTTEVYTAKYQFQAKVFL